MTKVEDISGERFGRLIAIRIAHDDPRSGTHWICQCDCGRKKAVRITYLRAGRTKSCGCLQREETSVRATVHGGKRSRLYKTWLKMRGRCNCHTDRSYSNYGGRGITVCQEWDDFASFRTWSLENGYSDKLSIDRINNDAGYEPSNCRWATQKEQARNTRRNRLITASGETRTLGEWAEITGLAYAAIRSRLNLGWSHAEALGKIPHHRKPRKHPGRKLNEDQVRDIKASSVSGAELARTYGVSKSLISRIRNGFVWKGRASIDEVRTHGRRA